MRKTDLNEAVAIGTAILTALSKIPNNGQLTYDCGVLLSQLGAQISSGAIWSPAGLLAVFEEARVAGATYVQIDTIRMSTSALAPKGAPALTLQAYTINLCLGELAQILAATSFTARADIDTALDAINLAFASAIETASNALDAVVYQALVSLNAAVAQSLSSRAQTLPRMVTFKFPAALPSLYLAQRIYADGSRADEIAQENKAQHPLFISSPIRALSA